MAIVAVASVAAAFAMPKQHVEFGAADAVAPEATAA